jgi:tRNA-2-methylthio-N6-dimethylallyladenosine synthase
LATRLVDDVPETERTPLRARNQAGIAGGIGAALVGRTVEVLVEARHRDRWKGRTRTNKLVFLDSAEDLRGRLVPARIEWAGPWSLVGAPALNPARIEPSLAA